jgi:osmotically-inducible protein OsmY
MKRVIPFIAVLALGAAMTGCNQGPNSKTAYNNSGANANAGAGTTTSAPADTSTTTTTTTTSTPTTSDTASTNTAATSASGTSPAGGTNVVTDTVTSGKIMAALAGDPGLKDTDINVKSEGGVVTLGGTVKSQDQVQIATNLAQHQDGVSRVESQISVR